MADKKYSASELRGPSVADPRPNSEDSRLARKLIKTFKKKDPAPLPYATGWKWPTRYRHIGVALSEAYSSDKWVKDYDFQEWKHLAEGEHALFATPAAWDGFKFKGPIVTPSEDGLRMPTHISELSILLFFEARLFIRVNSDGGVLGTGDEGVVRVEVHGALLYGGHAERLRRGFGEKARETFLMIGTKADGPLFVITAGEGNTEFDILSDGIVG